MSVTIDKIREKLEGYDITKEFKFSDSSKSPKVVTSGDDEYLLKRGKKDYLITQEAFPFAYAKSKPSSFSQK